MGNHSSTTQWLDEIISIETMGGSIVNIDLGQNRLMMMEKQFEIKVGDNKVKVSTFDFMQAFKDMLDTGVFEMDQIDESVWKLEKHIEDLNEQNSYLNIALDDAVGNS